MPLGNFIQYCSVHVSLYVLDFLKQDGYNKTSPTSVVDITYDFGLRIETGRERSLLLYITYCVCVCVFSFHSFWTSISLDIPAGVTQEEGHTGFLIHLLSAVRALIFSREGFSLSFPSSTVKSNFVY